MKTTPVEIAPLRPARISPLAGRRASLGLPVLTTCLTLLAASASLTAQPLPPIPGTWQLTFEDTFDGAVLDGSKWKMGLADAGIEGQGGNNPANISVANGKLTLKATTTPSTFCGSPFAYSTGEISSWMRFNQQHGYFEARMRWDTATGMWPAFWLMPERANHGTQEWFNNSFLKFNLTGSGITTVTSAKLRLKTVVVGNSLTSPNNLQVFAVANDSWAENTVTWNNQPVRNPLFLEQKWNFSPAPGDIVEFDVTSYVQTEISGDGVVSLGLSDEFWRARGMEFYSRETANTADRPTLVVNGTPFYPTADATVKWGAHANTNFGTATQLQIRTDYENTTDSTYNGGMEIDIMETLGIWGPNVTSHALHWDGYGSDHKAAGWGPVPTLNTSNYRTYGMYWAPGLIEFYVDGVKTGSYTNVRAMSVPAYLILSLQLGGWDNNTPGAQVNNKVFDIDHVRVWSGTKSTTVASATTRLIDGSIRFGTDHTGYSGNATPSITLADDGTSLTLSADGWAKFPLPYTVTPSTVLEFTVDSAATGEILALGLEDNDNNADTKRLFHLAGSQAWANAWTNYKDYVTQTGPKTYSIPLGTFYTGAMTHLAFANDNDGGNKKVYALYRNVKIHEGAAGLASVNFTSTEGYANGTLHDQPGSSPAWKLVSGSNSFTVNLTSGLVVNTTQTATQNAVWQTPVNSSTQPALTHGIDFDFVQSAPTGGASLIASLGYFYNATSGSTNLKAFFARNSGTDTYRIGFYQANGTPATSLAQTVTGAAIGLASGSGDNVSDPLRFTFTLNRGSSTSQWTGTITLTNRTTGNIVATLAIPDFATSTTFYNDTSLYPLIASESVQSAAISSLTITGYDHP
jgi:beta-glucanase (GH16 family)